jgi:HEAT repeat protein
MPWIRIEAIRALAVRSDAEALEGLIEGLQDEIELVRGMAAQALLTHALRLPVDRFRALAQDTSRVNAGACLVAARVFGTHVDEVPIEDVVALFRSAPHPTVAAMAVWAMGNYGARAPVELLARIALASLEPGPHEIPMMDDVRVHKAAAQALRTLGTRAPVEALIAGLYHLQAAADAAQALLVHPGPVPDDVRGDAEAIVRGEKRYLKGRP